MNRIVHKLLVIVLLFIVKVFNWSSCKIVQIFQVTLLLMWSVLIESLNYFFFAAAMIHWIRQIKEVLATQNSYEMVENSGPLDEIEFWNKRCMNLTGISNQLDKYGIKKVTEVLTLSKSSYIEPFLKVSEQIKVMLFFCYWCHKQITSTSDWVLRWQFLELHQVIHQMADSDVFSILFLWVEGSNCYTDSLTIGR